MTSLTQGSHADVARYLQESFIWSDEIPVGQQTYVAFRKTFTWSGEAGRCWLHGFADSRYLVWLNGRPIHRGPSRFHPGQPEFDSLDVTDWLQPGPNALAVLVHHYAGVTNGRIMRHAPGLTLAVEYDGRVWLRSGADWKCCAATEYQPSPSAWSSIPDLIDGRQSPGAWTSVDFVDDHWPAATPVDGGLWGPLRPRCTPLPKEWELGGVRVLPTGERLESSLPMGLESEEARPWSYPGGFMGKWMWSDPATGPVAFKAVWSNAGFGVGQASVLKVVCEEAFSLHHNGKWIATCADGVNGWNGEVDVEDGDVFVIQTEPGSAGPRSVGIFVSLLNQGHPMMGTPEFRQFLKPQAEDWLASKSLEGSRALRGSRPLGQGKAAGSLRESVVLDLGRMAMVFPEIELEAEDGSVLQVEYALRYVDGEPAESYGVGSTYIARAGRQRWLAADQWCARYVTLRCLSGRIVLHRVRMVDRRYPYERLGSFRCSDECLTRLWDMAVRTVEVTTDDAHGSDARERNEWVQDGSKASFHTMRVAAAGPDGAGGRVWSDPRTLRKLLLDAAACQMEDGRLPGTFPTDRGAEDPHHFIDDYAMQWVEALRWHQQLTRDGEFVRALWPTLVRQMDWFLARVTARGLLMAREYTSFDNPLAYQTCEGATVNAFFYQALCDAAWLAEEIGESAAAQHYRQRAGGLAAAYNALFWDQEEQAYGAAWQGEERLAPSVHAQLMALSSGVVPPERLAAVRAWFVRHFRNPGTGLVIGPKPDYRDWLEKRAGLDMPIMYYWAFMELYRMDQPDGDALAIGEMRRRWRHMVDFLQDAGTLSESFVNAQGGGMSESCHNYGSIPAYFLSSYVLGVRIELAVWHRRLVINPRCAGLDWADGVVVTPFGLVQLGWQRRDHDWWLQCQIPAGVQAEVRLADVDPNTLCLDGEHVPSEQDGRNTCLVLGAGNHRLSAVLRH